MKFSERFSFRNFFIVAFLFSFFIFLLLPHGTEQALKKQHKEEPKVRKTFPFHRITINSIKEDDDVDEDIRDFFEKVHHADVRASDKTEAHSDDDEEEEDLEEDKRRLTSGFFGWLFGFKKEAEETNEEEGEVVINDQVEAETGGETAVIEEIKPEKPDTNGNGIINWLQSLLQSEEKKKPPPAKEASGNIVSEYFNRWPFNVIFPIGKTQKIIVPKKKLNGKWKPGEPISDDDFETLLESFPSFIVNPNHVNDIDCKQQIQIWQRQLRGHKMWTLHMLDASGKIPSGVLRGNINQLGDFDMCTNIKTSVKITKQVSVRIKGKYCLAHLEIQSANDGLKLATHLAQGRGLWNSHLTDPKHFAPRCSLINWGICIPHACQSSIVRDMIDRSLQPYNRSGIYFHVEVNENDCYIRNSTRFKTFVKQNNNVAFTLGYFIAFVALALACVVIENRYIVKRLHRIIWSFLKPKLKKMKRDIRNFIKLAIKSHYEAKAEFEAQLKKEKEKEAKEGKKDNETTSEEKNEESEKKEEETVKEEPEVKGEVEETVEEVAEEASEETEEVAQDELDAFDRSESVFKEIILSFAPKRSIATLLSSEGSDTQFAILNIFKLFSTFMIYLCLKYLMLGHLPVLNRDKLIKSLDSPMSIFYRSPIIYFDILLIISGFIQAYQLCVEMEEKFHIYFLKRFILKILRIIPTVYGIILFQTYILPLLESGPLWNNLIITQSEICQETSWRNFFGVQNAINFEETCSPMTIQHSIEIQLFFLAPLFVWLFYCNSEIGLMVYGGIQIISVSARYYRTNIEHLSPTLFHGIHISKFYRTANLLYSSPIPRATSFLIGIGAGILHKTAIEEYKDMSKLNRIIGWLATGGALFYCFWSPSSAVRSDYIYNSVDAAAYSSWSPLILGLAISWIIFLTPEYKDDGERTPLFRLMSSKPILILSRISFSTQLVMYVVVFYFTAQQKEAKLYSFEDLINFKEIGMILVLAMIVTLVIDIPMKKVIKAVVNRLLPDKPASVMSSSEESEAESVGKSEEEKDTETKEEKSSDPNVYEADEDFVAGGIWGADPEEEEKRYLARRKSSLQQFNLDNSVSKEETQVESKEDEKAEKEEEEVEEEEDVEEEKKEPVKPPTPPPTTYRRRRAN